MFENKYTEYLKNNGWIEVSQMCFYNRNMDVEVFFDSSDQIVIYKNGKALIGISLNDLNDLLSAIRTAVLSV